MVILSCHLYCLLPANVWMHLAPFSNVVKIAILAATTTINDWIFSIRISTKHDVYSILTEYKRMPLRNRCDSQGCYWQWGPHGTRYYYMTARDGKHAKDLAIRQAIAIYYSRLRQQDAGRKRSPTRKRGGINFTRLL